MYSKVFVLIDEEKSRQDNTIELIASENYVSENVMKAMGSCLTNKYCEGYPSQKRHSGNTGRYYGGCEIIDKIEEYCCDTWRKVFNTDYHVNVQPHCGSNANMAAYMSILNPGDKILSMSLNNGGHLSHGSKVNFSGKLYDIYNYDVDDNGFIDYDNLNMIAQTVMPKLIVAGASAYSRIIDFERFNSIARSIGAYFMVDMAHIAGLIAVGDHPTPFGLADIITTTTHKTLRGPRGGMIFCKPELAKKIDSAVFPGTQGGPLEHIIAAKAIAAEEALTPEYAEYIHNVVANAKAMANEFMRLGYKVITGGTDNHLLLLDLTNTEFSGREVQDELGKFGIIVNKNCIPNETRPPKEASGIRIGTPAMTTRGFTEKDFIFIADEIDKIIKGMRHND